MANSTKVITGPKTRWSYVNVLQKDNNDKYSVSLIIPKDDLTTVKAIKEAIKRCYDEDDNKLKRGNTKVALNKLQLPLHDGDEERPEDSNYANAYYINAKATRKPDVVDKQLQPILDEEEVYSGCYGRASISFYAYNSNGNMGIACGLNNLQKVKDGERLGGGFTKAEDDFNDGFRFEEDDDDFDPLA